MQIDHISAKETPEATGQGVGLRGSCWSEAALAEDRKPAVRARAHRL